MEIKQREVMVQVSEHHAFASCAGCGAEGDVGKAGTNGISQTSAPHGWARVHRYVGEGLNLTPSAWSDVVVCPPCQRKPLTEVLNG